MSETKHPEVELHLSEEDGNAFAIMGRAIKAMRRAGLSSEEIKAYRDEATSGDYDNLLQVTMRYFSCV